MAAITKPQPLLKSEHFSDWERLIRVTAYCQRFVNNVKFIKKDPSKVNTDELQPEECKEAENYWIREAQRQLKSILNSRPLTYMSDDPNDLRPLTPNHLLLGRASADIPHGPCEDTRNTHKRFQYVQTIANNFWRRFIAEYVPKMIAIGRSKWQKSEIKKDDLVLIVESNVPRGKWNLGRVTEVFPGKDGVVRSVLLKTKNAEFKRSVQKCCLLLESKYALVISASGAPGGYVLNSLNFIIIEPLF